MPRSAPPAYLTGAAPPGNAYADWDAASRRQARPAVVIAFLFSLGISLSSSGLVSWRGVSCGLLGVREWLLGAVTCGHDGARTPSSFKKLLVDVAVLEGKP